MGHHRDDNACEVGCLLASSWVVVVRRSGFVWSRVDSSFERSCAVVLAGSGAGCYGVQSGRCFFFLI